MIHGVYHLSLDTHNITTYNLSKYVKRRTFSNVFGVSLIENRINNTKYIYSSIAVNSKPHRPSLAKKIILLLMRTNSLNPICDVRFQPESQEASKHNLLLSDIAFECRVKRLIVNIYKSPEDKLPVRKLGLFQFSPLTLEGDFISFSKNGVKLFVRYDDIYFI
jgi:hypothetical protein